MAIKYHGDASVHRADRSYCRACDRMFEPMRIVPADKLCRDCRIAAGEADPELFHVAPPEPERDTH